MNKSPKSRKGRAEAHEILRAAVGDPSTWDTADWKRWTISGRVVPERCNVELGPVTTALASSGLRCLLRLHVVNSHISVICLSDAHDSNVFQISDMVKNGLASMIDFISFMNRGYYDIVLDTCLDDATCVSHPIPIFEPIFDPPREGSLFTPASARFDAGVPLNTLNNDAFATALHDLSQAARYTPRTMEYCRMALEAVRSHFDPPDPKLDWRTRYNKGEEAMCSALKVSRQRLRQSEAHAAPSRHGERPYGMDWNDRKPALEFAWETVRRFQLYLEDTPPDDWSVFD